MRSRACAALVLCAAVLAVVFPQGADACFVKKRTLINCTLDKADTNHDRALSKDEADALLRQYHLNVDSSTIFNLCDENGDGSITVPEAERGECDVPCLVKFAAKQIMHC